jgi:hypothetical protein
MNTKLDELYIITPQLHYIQVFMIDDLKLSQKATVYDTTNILEPTKY